MPLPPSGNTAWPPPQLDIPHADMDMWRAWYSGNTDHLAAVYGGPTNYRSNAIARQFFEVDQRRGGEELRTFWGQSPSPGQQAAKLHVPIAADVAEMSANLLWSDVPQVTVDGDSTDKTLARTTQAQIGRYLDDRGHAKMREGAELAAGLSNVYLRVVWDTTLRPRPWTDVIAPEAVVPTWRWGALAEAIVWQELAPQEDANKVWRLLEFHTPGTIEYGLYEGKVGVLGMRADTLAAHPDTEYLVKRTDIHGRQSTGVDRMLITHLPNVLPNRVWDGVPGTAPLGRSDFTGIEPLMDALDETWCADESTEILTDHGWVSYRELAEGDNVLTLNHETGLSEWQPVLEVCVFPAMDREMVSMESRSHSSLTTPTHRWPVVRPHYRNGSGAADKKAVAGFDRTWATSATLRLDDRVPTAADCADLPVEPKYTDALVELVAWFWTEGHIRKLRDGSPGKNVCITQALKSEDADRIRASLAIAFGKPVERFPRTGKTFDPVPRWREAQNGDVIRFNLNAAAGEIVQRHAPGRVPSHEFLLALTKAQLQLFIDVSMLADNSGPSSLAQKDRAAAEAFQFACTLAGYGTSLSSRVKTGKVFKPGTVMWDVRIRSQRQMWPGRPGQRETVTYTGEVWCPRTQNQTWLARRNGKVYFTGNTSWMRDLRLGKARLLVPQSMLETEGAGSGGIFDLDKEISVALNLLGGESMKDAITEVQFNIRVEAHEQTSKALRLQILSSAGYSAQGFGEAGTVAATATEVVARKEESLTTRGTKLLYQRPALVEHLTTMMMVDVKHCGAKGVDPAAELTASWPQAVRPDPEATARTLSLLDTAGAISDFMKVKWRSPELDDAEVEAEVRRIRADKRADLVSAGDPFNTGGGIDPNADPTAAGTGDGSDTAAGADEPQEDPGGEPALKVA